MVYVIHSQIFSLSTHSESKIDIINEAGPGKEGFLGDSNSIVAYRQFEVRLNLEMFSASIKTKNS
jgi:hypothetical protein